MFKAKNSRDKFSFSKEIALSEKNVGWPTICKSDASTVAAN